MGARQFQARPQAKRFFFFYGPDKSKLLLYITRPVL